MAEIRTMARPYARAVFEIARGNDALAAWSEALAAVAAIVSNETVRQIVDNPNISDQQLVDSIIDLAGDAVPEQAHNYVRLLVENERLLLAPAIAEQFEDMRAAVEQRVDVTVVSAAAIPEQQKQALAASLEKRLAANVELTFEQDASIIGGAVIRAGDLVIDHSLRSQLTRMQNSLTH